MRIALIHALINWCEHGMQIELDASRGANLLSDSLSQLKSIGATTLLCGLAAQRYYLFEDARDWSYGIECRSTLEQPESPESGILSHCQ